MVKWDLYDKDMKKTNIVIDSETTINDGYYHMSVNAWIINDKKEVLLVRNALNYELYYPGFWGPISENVLSGDDGIKTVYNAVLDYVGKDINVDKMEKIGVEKRDPFHYMYETYIIKENIDLKEFRLNNDKIINVRWVSYNELNNMLSNGEIALAFQSRIEKHILPLLK